MREQVFDGGRHGVLARIGAKRPRVRNVVSSGESKSSGRRSTMAGRCGAGHPDRRRRLGRPDRGARHRAERAGPRRRGGRREAAERGQARRARLGDRGGGAAHARAARHLADARGRGAADPLDGDHRQPHARCGAAGLPDLRRRGVGGRALRAYGAERAARSRRCARRRWRRASCSPRRIGRRLRARTGGWRSASRSGEERQRARCSSRPTASARGCARSPASRR